MAWLETRAGMVLNLNPTWILIGWLLNPLFKHLKVDSPMNQKNDRRTLFGWCMYDWANSAFATTILAALLPAYFAGEVVGPEGVVIAGTLYSATTLWGLVVGFAALLIFLTAPFLGAIADFSASKKRFLLTFAYGGALFTLLLFFCKSGDVFLTLLIFLMAQIGFIAANVFYDAFLPQIATEDKIDWVSGKGFAFGYLGGALQFALCLGLVAGHDYLGISQTLAARIGMAMAGMWWAGFTLFTWKFLKEAPSTHSLPETVQSNLKVMAYARVGFSRLWQTARRVSQFKHLLLFLIAFMLYNDGIQTVINMATIYGKEELGLSTTTLMVTLLIIQIIAIAGALSFSRLAGWIGAKRAVMVTLVLWTGVVIYGYFIQTATEYFILGVIVGIVLGGSQALSRSLYGAMIPEDASAEFYGFYSVFSKFSAIWGPLVFAVIRQVAGSARISIVSLMVFFIAGLILLAFVDEAKAREAKLSPS
jgi:UMF1 family MFS transporter